MKVSNIKSLNLKRTKLVIGTKNTTVKVVSRGGISKTFQFDDERNGRQFITNLRNKDFCKNIVNQIIS